jgi:Na+(H+)/acetate symporter ActP
MKHSVDVARSALLASVMGLSLMAGSAMAQDWTRDQIRDQVRDQVRD